MEKSKASTVILIIAVFIVAAGALLNGHYHFLGGSTPAKTTKELYYCPMHPNFTSDKPRECPICGMSLVKRETAGPTGDKPSQGTIMTQTGVYINPAKQQLIGVKKQKVEVRKLSGKILTVGKVAYDPDLYVAQDEYLQSVKTNKNVAENDSNYAAEQPESFTKTARRKLLLLG
ncbi:MAG: hypothetical protein NTW55_00120, partial [Planctomycetota bacterium]|nr:hypothetical protein [Planctomycetota bacterium]